MGAYAGDFLLEIDVAVFLDVVERKKLPRSGATGGSVAMGVQQRWAAKNTTWRARINGIPFLQCLVVVRRRRQRLQLAGDVYRLKLP